MKYTNIFSKIVVAFSALIALNFASGKAFGAVACNATTAGGVTPVPVTSQDADHIYYSGHDANFSYDAVYHIHENFVYLVITVGQSSNAPQVSGNFLLNGVGLSATLDYKQGSKFAQLDCAD